MKLKKDYFLRKVADVAMVVPLGKEMHTLGGVLRLNDTAAFLFGFFAKEHTPDEAVDALLKEYEVERELAERAVQAFIGQMKEYKLWEE